MANQVELAFDMVAMLPLILRARINDDPSSTGVVADL